MLNKFISFALFALFAFSCTVEEQARYVKGNPDDVKPVQKTGDNTLIDTRVFNIINLDYPGMEAVKECHSAGNEYGAAAALLDYYRGRGTVDNIFVDLLSPLVNEAEISMANQASKEGGYRFYVRATTAITAIRSIGPLLPGMAVSTGISLPRGLWIRNGATKSSAFNGC